MSEAAPHAGREQRRQQLREELKKLQDIHQASEGRQILARTYAFEDSYYVFLVSQGELKGFLDHIDASAVSVHMWDMRHRYRLDYAQREVVRRLHNYVAAAFSLVGATRVFVNEHYEYTDLIREYNDRVKRDFREAPLHRFLQDLRNYTLHYRLPATRANFNFRRREDGGFDFDNGFRLDVDKLREWDKWTARAREYLEALGPEADLANIIGPYEPVVTEFHEWLAGRIKEEHATEIQELYDLEARLKEVQEEWEAAWGDPQVEQQETAQESSRVPLVEPSSEAGASHLATIDDLISAFYESMSFPFGGVPNLDRFRSLFLPNARLIQAEAGRSYLVDLDDYFREFHEELADGRLTALSETETGRKKTEFGNGAHILSTSEGSSRRGESTKRTKGLHSFHLVQEGGRWCIATMYWFVVEDGNPVPGGSAPEGHVRENDISEAREIQAGGAEYSTRRRTSEGRSMAQEHTTMTAEVRGLEPFEDAEIPLFEAPFDGLIANVVFTSSEDVQGAYYTRQLDFSVHRDGALHHAVGSIQLGTDRVLLPGGEKYNAHLYFPPISLRVHEGDTLVWSSIGSVGEGLAVSEGVVEIVFERKDTPDRPTYSPELWSEYVPDYWIGKDALVEVNNRDIHSPNTPSGSFSTFAREDLGTVVRAHAEGIVLSLHPKEHGHLPQDSGCPYTQVGYLKLIEDG
jgi:hypothetical protein